MTGRIRSAVLTFLVVSLFLAKPPAWGCSCAGTTSLLEEFAGADVVFSGTVAKVRLNWRYFVPLIWYWPLHLVGLDVEPPDEYQARVYFEVMESFKGSEDSRVTVSSDLDTAGCGIPWEVGWEVIVYAYSEPEAHPPLVTNSCSRTMLANEDELADLRSVD